VTSSAIRDEKVHAEKASRKNEIYRRKKTYRRFRGRSLGSGTFFQPAPVKEGQEIDVVIDDIGSRGDGITRMQGFLIFVPQTKIGERLKVKVVKVKGRFAIAEKVR